MVHFEMVTVVNCMLRALYDTHRSLFIQQLRPTQNLQPRIKLKLFGHSGSGKTTLVESLKCGLLRSFFRRRRPRLSSTNSTRFPPSPLASKPNGENLPDVLGVDAVVLSGSTALLCLWSPD
ncbi:death-associated protein kinase 1-like [Myotis myotis]|uniref:death-associated protein kinase 1-like n=1 Tax=Myotis myotis TaxID=51298 RepID=UPI0017488183|nr:death-associated protein kinase 1-like [Myotis myotis]